MLPGACFLGQNEDGSWGTETDRLLLMDSRDFNRLGVGVDDLIEAYMQVRQGAGRARAALVKKGSGVGQGRVSRRPARDQPRARHG